MGSSISVVARLAGRRSHVYLTETNREDEEQKSECSEESSNSSSTSEEIEFPNPNFCQSRYEQYVVECMIAKKRFVGLMNHTKSLTDKAMAEAQLYSSLKNKYHGSELLPNTYVLKDMVSRGTKLAVAKWCGTNVANTVDQVAVVTTVRRWRTKEVMGDDTAILESQKYTNKIEYVTESHLVKRNEATPIGADAGEEEGGENVKPKRVNPFAYIPPDEKKKKKKPK